ncbi:MAG TPA: serine hydrolase [Anaerolineae bacterium]|nr:serine hydrolase [Anaerolineae bacterium]
MVKKLFLALFILISLYAVREGWFYFLERQKLPLGATIADVSVEYLTLKEAGEKVAQVYAQPIVINSAIAGERVEIAPSEVGFDIDLAGMLAEAEAQHNALQWWVGYLGYLLSQPIDPITVPLLASHDVNKVREVVEIAAELMEDPTLPPRLEPRTLRFLEGKSGYDADRDATQQLMITALYNPSVREIELPLTYREPPPLDMQLLADQFEQQLDVDGLVTIAFLKDLQTGEEINIRADTAVSGLSIMKIPILIEVYRVIDGQPNFDQQQLLNQMIIESSNLAANLLLDVVAGQDNAYLGSDILTESMAALGLENTYIVTPYEEPARPEKPVHVTPANSVEELLTDPEPSMQTTAEDIGTLLSMIYDCSKGGGALLALYPDQLDSAECQAMIDLLMLNVEGTWMIRDGMPEDTTVAHKHGYGFDIHGDAGLIMSDGGDYVLVMYVSDPGVDWLVADLSFPIMRGLSRIAYNYYNNDNPYLGFREYELEEPHDEAVEVTDSAEITTTLSLTSTITAEP